MIGRRFSGRICFYFVVSFPIAVFLASIFSHQMTRILRKRRTFNPSEYNLSFSIVRQFSKDIDCPFNDQRLQDIHVPFRAIVVNTCGSFLERVQTFNEEIQKLRLEALRFLKDEKWKPVTSEDHIKLIWTSRDNFLQHLERFSQLRLVMLPWNISAGTGQNWTSLRDTSNLLIQRYYEWTADDQLCTWIETPGMLKFKFDVIFNRTCYRDVKKTTTFQSMKTFVLNAKPFTQTSYWPNDGKSYPRHFYTQQPPFAFYMYIIRDGIVTENSDVYSGNLKLVQYACSSEISIDPPYFEDWIPFYDEVFPIAQFWGTGYFHAVVEVLPRLALYVEFLQRNPNIKILVPETGGRIVEFLQILGLDKRRLIAGTSRAKLIYLPRSSMCGFANVQEIQVLSLLFRKYIANNFPVEPRDKIVLIRRSHSRKFTEQTEIEKVVKESAKAHNLNYVLFIDNPVPSLEVTMRMFHSAVMVVAPHGAGLANVVFSQPGTYVIEGVCNLPHVNLCFQRLSYVLGHHWHGITSRRGCESVVDVSAESIKKAVDTPIEIINLKSFQLIYLSERLSSVPTVDSITLTLTPF